MLRPFTCLFVLLLAAAPAEVAADTLYVDGTLTSDCSTYDVAGRSCGGGSARAFDAMAGAAIAVAAGDTILLRAGAYEDPLHLTTSGRSDAPIMVRAADGESVVIENVGEPAIFVDGASYVTVEGLTVRDVLGWGRLEDVDHVTIRGMTFERAEATGTTGSLKLVRATQCTVEDSSFVSGNDNIVMQESDANRIVRNEFREGRHSLLSVRCSNRNVFRDNRFENSIQKSMEIFDCEGVSDAPFRLDATRRNLIENNRFEGTLGSDRDHRYNAIQYAGQEGIVRRNVFFDNLGGGLAFQVYESEALNNYGHHAYNNTIVDNPCHGLIGSNAATSAMFHSNAVRFNVLLGNTGCAGEAVQENVRNTEAVQLEGNVLADADPGFQSRSGRDFSVTMDSSLIDAAGFLAQTTGAGSGTSLAVDDASPFFDGNGIEGETGDTIQLEGDTARARILSIDLATGVMQLDGPLDWAAGQGVALAYEGAAPDVGAFERGSVDPPAQDGGVPAVDAGPGGDDAGSGTVADAGPGASLDAGAGGGDGGGDGGCAAAPRGAHPCAPLGAFGFVLGVAAFRRLGRRRG